jgi:hypothetical protein
MPFVAVTEGCQPGTQRTQRRRAVKYVILILDTPDSQALSEAESDAWMKEVMAWYEKVGQSGKLADGGAQLASSSKARTVRASGVTDGPFMEAKEVLGGFSVLETDTIDEAVEIAKTWPGVDRGWITIEVRPYITQ